MKRSKEGGETVGLLSEEIPGGGGGARVSGMLRLHSKLVAGVIMFSQ